MAALIFGPILAATLVADRQPQAGPTQPAVTDAQSAVRVELRTAPLAVAESLHAQTPPPATPAPKATPTRTPAPAPTARPAAKPAVVAPPPAAPGSVVAIIEAAAARWGVSGSWMVSIARCESGLRTNAVNPSGHYGLFQFLQSTFTGNGGTNIWSAADQSNITAKMLAHGQAHQWSCA
ncbi:MAG: transglycosylase family protein [Candidatus Dormibacter sp.]